MTEIGYKTLLNFFEGFKAPSEPFYLSEGSLVEDPQSFVESHLLLLKAGKNKPWVVPYYDRLVIYYKQLHKKSKE